MKLETYSFVRKTVLENTNTHSNVKKIYIDMDGVLADFDGWKLEYAKTHPEILTSKDEFWRKASKVDRLYYNLKPMPEAKQLMTYLQSLNIPLAILTALPRKSSIPSAEADKQQWVRENLGDIEFNVGPYAKNKQRFSGAGLMLIDDKIENVQEWEAKGGIGILYTGFNKAKQDIEKAL
jgi:5'(3')-deoxyribonucleotidase